MSAREELAAEALLESIRDNLPESFWDAAVWVGPNWLTGRLDAADRKRITLALLASPALADLIRKREEGAWEYGVRLALAPLGRTPSRDLLDRNPYRADQVEGGA